MLEPRFEQNPLMVFQAWFAEAEQTGAVFPDAMALATATPDGRPSVRIVLYKGMSGDGIRFFTNYDSRKARELSQNPRAALAIHWPALGRQVRMEGAVERLPRAESEAYFASRPRESQLGACVSPQSRPIASRSELERAYSELERSLAGAPVVCPEGWGGFRLVPDVIEFWINRDARLHERIEYRRAADGRWHAIELAP